jgi:hypothetical protein
LNTAIRDFLRSLRRKIPARGFKEEDLALFRQLERGEFTVTKRQYGYRITVTPVSAPNEAEPLRPPVSFEATNHDDIIAIIGRMQAGTGLPADDAAAVAVGLKLFSEVMLREKHNPLFDPLRGGVREFIGRLKAQIRQEP